MTTFIRIVVSVALLAAVAGAVWATSNPSDVAEAISQLKWPLIVAVIALLAIGVLLASLRLKLIAADQGYALSIRDAMMALTVGQLVGNLFFQIAGQLVGRTAVFARRGIPPAASFVLFAYERFFALLISFGLAVWGAIYLFGGVHLDLSSGGESLVRLSLGLAAAIGAGAVVAWRKVVVSFFEDFTSRHVMRALRNGVLSLSIQLTTLAAYVLLGMTLSPGVDTSMLVAASCIIMFAASLPISLGGWGLREMSAVFVLQTIDFSAAAALLVGLIVGVLSIVVLGVTAALLALMDRKGTDATMTVSTATTPDYGAALDWIVPIAAATAVFFQIYVPTNEGRINVNLADPLVLVGGALFALRGLSIGWSQWRVPGLSGSVLLATAVVILSFLHGVAVFGYTEWAFTNRTLGWAMLLCYAATGALIVQRAHWVGIEVLLLTIIAAAAAVTVVAGIDLASVRLEDSSVADDVERMAGFSQNPNAFAFVLLMALAATLALARHERLRFGMLVVIILGLVASQSRAAYATAPVIVAIAVWCGVALRPVLRAVAVAFSIVGVFYLFPLFHTFVLDALAAPATPGDLPPLEDGPGDFERLRTVKEGLKMFLAHPIFGAGLGAYAYERLQADGYVQVIHSTPIWLLAETGLAGFAVFMTAAYRIVKAEWARRTEPVGLLILLVLSAMAVMSVVHELLYQRTFWLVLGAALALPVEASDDRQAPS
jgi:O-antigen ligase